MKKATFLLVLVLASALLAQQALIDLSKYFANKQLVVAKGSVLKDIKAAKVSEVDVTGLSSASATVSIEWDSNNNKWTVNSIGISYSSLPLLTLYSASGLMIAKVTPTTDENNGQYQLRIAGYKATVSLQSSIGISSIEVDTDKITLTLNSGKELSATGTVSFITQLATGEKLAVYDGQTCTILSSTTVGAGNSISVGGGSYLEFSVNDNKLTASLKIGTSASYSAVTCNDNNDYDLYPVTDNNDNPIMYNSAHLYVAVPTGNSLGSTDQVSLSIELTSLSDSFSISSDPQANIILDLNNNVLALEQTSSNNPLISLTDEAVNVDINTLNITINSVALDLATVKSVIKGNYTIPNGAKLYFEFNNANLTWLGNYIGNITGLIKFQAEATLGNYPTMNITDPVIQGSFGAGNEFNITYNSISKEWYVPKDELAFDYYVSILAPKAIVPIYTTTTTEIVIKNVTITNTTLTTTRIVLTRTETITTSTILTIATITSKETVTVTSAAGIPGVALLALLGTLVRRKRK